MIKLLCVIALLFSSNAMADDRQETKTLRELVSMEDPLCENLKKIGVCELPAPPRPGEIIEYMEPAFIIETVKKPGDYVISDYGGLVTGTLGSMDDDRSSASSSLALSGSNVQFNETHVYKYPANLLKKLDKCGPDLTELARTPFFSEKYNQRKEAWRKPAGEFQYLGRSLGEWGKLFPRTGFLTHWSSKVASAVTCARAVSIVTSDQLLFGHKIQQVYPRGEICKPLGERFSDDHISKDGRYVWIYWRYRVCCRDIRM